jgi:transcriptional regulator with XRE-family HTH domain
MTTALGEKIQKLRKEKGLTLEQLAELTESSKSYIWELENKSPPRPSADKLSKIAAKLGVTMDYLIDQEEKITEADATDEMFFRKYRQMDPEVKKKFRKMVELWEDE